MKKLLLGILAVGSCALLRADFTYQETSQMTGGSLMAMMNALGPLARQAREPNVSTHIVKGNRMATVTKDRTTIMDLDKETITTIDNAKKTYTVVTFEQMKQTMEQAQERMAARKGGQGDGQMNFKVSAKATGQTKTVQGLKAKEMVIDMAMEGTDAKSGQSGAMNITTDAWYAPVPGYDEVKAFHQKMAVKMGYIFGSGMGQIAQMGMGQPNMQKGMEEVAKELSKVDGVPVESLVKMGGSAAPGAGGDAAASQPPAQQQQQNQGGGLAGAALGRLGGFGGLGRRKNNDQQQQAPADQAGATPGPAGGQAPASGTLMEMTMSLTSFSSGAADGSKFEIPAGYKQVEPDARRGGR
jgi:hypothetical protein